MKSNSFCNKVCAVTVRKSINKVYKSAPFNDQLLTKKQNAVLPKFHVCVKCHFSLGKEKSKTSFSNLVCV